jgi:hypothetical protein
MAQADNADRQDVTWDDVFTAAAAISGTASQPGGAERHTEGSRTRMTGAAPSAEDADEVAGSAVADVPMLRLLPVAP